MAEPTLFENQWKIIALEEEAQFAPNGIVSRTLFRTGAARQVLFGFAAGEELTDHTSPHHALVQIVSGCCQFALAGEWREMKAGALLYMPPGLPHAVKATEKFSMLLTLISTEPNTQK